MAEELVAILGGTGLGDALAENIKNPEFIGVTTPFGKPSDRLMIGNIGKRRVAFINRHGKGHKLSPSEVPFAANIFALKKIGCRTLIATGAVGSLRQSIRPGELVIVDQFIDKTYRRQSSFFAGYGAVHCEMSEPVCERLSKRITAAATNLLFKTHTKGAYVCMEGPTFSTRAESLMHRKWGGDLIGMTAMPEAKLAREAQMCYALIALVSDYDCWRPKRKLVDKQQLLREIIGNMKLAADNCLKLLEAVLKEKEKIADETCDCRRSLDLAVWTDKDSMTAAEKKKVAVLFE
ncbi:MAG: S-methyl-5'-thioadenosine phosphorylase [Sedimentisphaerales bacterium]|nr:S-methyl-5'-thioadenosine phosphorylase [Sedimentisphaerales bacterium]